MTVIKSPLQNNMDVERSVTAVSKTRRYYVDWLRTLALGLLIIYHTTISFQPWASFIGFPTNAESLEWLVDWHGVTECLAHSDSLSSFQGWVYGLPWSDVIGKRC